MSGMVGLSPQVVLSYTGLYEGLRTHMENLVEVPGMLVLSPAHMKSDAKHYLSLLHLDVEIIVLPSSKEFWFFLGNGGITLGYWE